MYSLAAWGLHWWRATPLSGLLDAFLELLPPPMEGALLDQEVHAAQEVLLWLPSTQSCQPACPAAPQPLAGCQP